METPWDGETYTCFVPKCELTIRKGEQGIWFVNVPKAATRRKRWFEVVKKEWTSDSATAPLYCCGLHFDEKEDLELVNSDGKELTRLKQTVLPRLVNVVPEEPDFDTPPLIPPEPEKPIEMAQPAKKLSVTSKKSPRKKIPAKSQGNPKSSKTESTPSIIQKIDAPENLICIDDDAKSYLASLKELIPSISASSQHITAEEILKEAVHFIKQMNLKNEQWMERTNLAMKKNEELDEKIQKLNNLKQSYITGEITLTEGLIAEAAGLNFSTPEPKKKRRKKNKRKTLP